MNDDTSRQCHRARGQSHVVGIVMLIGLISMVAATVVVVGAHSLDDARAASDTEDAAITFTELQSQAAELSPDGESTYQVSLGEQLGSGGDAAAGAAVESGNEGDSTVRPSAGHVTIEGPGGTILDEDLGTVEYERNGQNLAYQAGGVFWGNAEGEESTVVSPPPFDYQYQSGTPTLSVPFRTVSTDTGDVLSGSDLTLEASTSTRHFPAGSGPSNPIDASQTVTVRIDSEYYLAWGDLFEERTNAEPEYDHANDVVEITLFAETEIPDVEGAFAGAPSTGNALLFDHRTDFETYHSTSTASGDATTYVRGAFDASSGAQSGQGSITGDFIVEDWLEIDTRTGSDPLSVSEDTIVGGETGETSEIAGKSEFNNLHVTGDLELSGQGSGLEVSGDVYVDGDLVELNRVNIDGDLHVDGNLLSESRSSVGGEVHVSGTDASGWSVSDPEPEAPKTPSLPPNDPVTPEIENRGDGLEETNDNPEDGTIANIKASGGCSSTCVLESGNYYVDGPMNLDSGERLEFDTSDGPVEIYVEDGVDVDGGYIDIRPDEPVLLFNDGDFEWDGGDVQTGPHGEHAPSFWVYMHPDADATFHDRGFVGVLYAPGEGSGELTMTQHATIRGAVVAQMDPNIDKHTEIWFDEALIDADPDPGGLEGQRVNYLQISTTEIEVSD